MTTAVNLKVCNPMRDSFLTFCAGISSHGCLSGSDGGIGLLHGKFGGEDLCTAEPFYAMYRTRDSPLRIHVGVLLL